MSLRDFLYRPSLLVGSLLVLLFVGTAIFAPLIAPPKDADAPQYIPREGNSPIPEPPSQEHILGLLPYKYDVFYGLVWGTRVALMMGLTIALGRTLLGVMVGLISGYAGGVMDAVLMRIADAFMAFPMIAALVVMLALFGYMRNFWPSGWINLQRIHQEQVLMLAFVLFGWVPYARLIRGNVLVEREKTYIDAARSIGVPPWRMIARYLFPNSTHGLIALISADIGAVVVLISAFTFIGILGTEPKGMPAECNCRSEGRSPTAASITARANQ